MPKVKKQEGLPKIERLRGDGAWHCRLYMGKDENGKQVIRSLTHPDYNQLVMMIMEAKREKEENDRAAALGLCTMTVREAMDELMRLKAHVWSPSTIKAYKSVRTVRFQSIADRKVSDLTARDVQSAIDAEAAHLSPKTVANAYGLLRAVLKAYRSDILEKLNTTVTVPKKQRVEIRIPTDAEITTLYEQAKGTEIELPFLLGAFLGLRRSEISGLKWKDIDFAHNTLTVRRVLVKDAENNVVEKKTAKTYESQRTLQMTKIVRDALEASMNEMAAEGPAEEIGERFITQEPDYITKHFRLCQESAGITDVYRFHDLRHYFCSTAILCNIPQAYVSKMLGHSSERMVRDVYTHLQEQKKTENIAIMDRYIDGLTSQSK